MKYSISKEILVAFLNQLNYDYHFTIRELGKYFEEELDRLGEFTEKYTTLEVKITKEVKTIYKTWKENTISYRLQFADSTRFISDLLSNLVENLAESIHKIKFTCEHDNKHAKRVELNAKIVSALLNTQVLKIIW